MSGKASVLVIGGGGIGTMLSYALETGGKANVTMVLRSNYEVVLKSGFSIDSVDHGKGIRGWRPTTIRNTTPDVNREPMVGPFDFVVVATKNISDVSPTVVELIEPAITPITTSIVMMQNGLNIEKPVMTKFPDNPVLSGVQLMGATEKSHGVIAHDEPDKSMVGPFRSDDSENQDTFQRSVIAARKFVEIYNACGKVDCKYDEDVKFTRWRKLVYNSSYNSVSAVLKMDVTRMRLYEHPIDDLVKPIMLEIVAIAAAAAGVRIPEETVMFFIMVDSLDSWFMPSMGQDAVKVKSFVMMAR